MAEIKNLPALRISSEVALPDNSQWENRFEIQSETSNRVYVIAQHKTLRHWGCSCPAWITRGYCKHLSALGIPNNKQPYEVNLIKE